MANDGTVSEYTVIVHCFGLGGSRVILDKAINPGWAVLDVRDNDNASRVFFVFETACKQVRETIVENFRERMQLRRSLIELEDQNVQNSIEVR